MNEILRHLPTLRGEVLYLGSLVIAVLVTIHVLLTKREVTSSVGWIGFAWFAPISGGIAYFVFGINRVQRRALKERAPEQRRGGRAAWPSPGGDDHLDPLERGIGRITGRPTLGGNQVVMYSNGDEAYPPMLTAIAEARHSIGLCSYIFDTDIWGMRFIEALAEAKGRGVQVRVLVDGIGAGWLRSRAYHALRHRGVPAERFLHSPLPWRMPFLNLRCHKKILVIDGSVGFTGGMNIADSNVMATHPAKPVQDTHFRLEGPVIIQLTEAFAQDWTFATDETLDGEAWFPASSDANERTGAGTPARVIDSGPDEDIEKIEFAVLEAAACARESIAVMTPYFLPDDRMTAALSLAALRGIPVDVIVPTVSDHRFIDWACHANLGPLLKDGVRVWQSAPPFRHSKIIVVDGEWCLIGSSNWDNRSFRLNFELCVELYDNGLAGQLTALMERCRASQITASMLDARSLPVRLRDAATRLALPYL